MGDKKKKAPIPYWEQVMWWCALFGSIFVVVSAFPMIPWRYSRVDTNMGNRFVMERYYNVLGATNNMGKYVNWFTMKRKIQRKGEEFGKPSPMSALAGTVTSSLGVGGAAAGCANWQQCKDHVNSRWTNYATLAYVSVFNLAFMGIGAICGIASIVFLGFEQEKYGKKDKEKKKKKKGESICDFAPPTKTMICSIVGFFLPFSGVSAYVMMTGKILETFKETAYYPYAGAYVGPFIAGTGVFLLWIGMMIAIHRVYPYTSRGSKDEDDEGLMEGEGQGEYPGGQGGYPGGAYGAYGGQGGYDPNAYGAASGGAAGYAYQGEQQQQW